MEVQLGVEDVDPVAGDGELAGDEAGDGVDVGAEEESVDVVEGDGVGVGEGLGTRVRSPFLPRATLGNDPPRSRTPSVGSPLSPSVGNGPPGGKRLGSKGSTQWLPRIVTYKREGHIGRCALSNAMGLY